MMFTLTYTHDGQIRTGTGPWEWILQTLAVAECTYGKPTFVEIRPA